MSEIVDAEVVGEKTKVEIAYSHCTHTTKEECTYYHPKGIHQICIACTHFNKRNMFQQKSTILRAAPNIVIKR